MNSELEELAALYVLDRLDPGERAAFEDRLPRSPDLAVIVRDLEAALAREVRALPQHFPPADLLARIESRLDRVAAVQAAVAPPRKSGPAWAAIARWGLAAVIAVSVATLAVQSLRRSSTPAAPPVVLVFGLDSQGGSARTEMPLPPAASAGEGSFVRLAALAEDLWEKPKQLPVAPSADAPSAHGYALFDPGSNQGFIAIRHLPALAPGHRYCVWIADPSSGRVTEAGILPAAEVTSGLYSFALASPEKERPARLNLFITAEDASALRPDAPRGKVVLGRKDI